jgi:hypothetical protein
MAIGAGVIPWVLVKSPWGEILEAKGRFSTLIISWGVDIFNQKSVFGPECLMCEFRVKLINMTIKTPTVI